MVFFEYDPLHVKLGLVPAELCYFPNKYHHEIFHYLVMAQRAYEIKNGNLIFIKNMMDATQFSIVTDEDLVVMKLKAVLISLKSGQ